MKSSNTPIIVNVGDFLRDSAAGLRAIGMRPFIQSQITFGSQKNMPEENIFPWDRNFTIAGAGGIAIPHRDSKLMEFLNDKARVAEFSQSLIITQIRKDKHRENPVQYEIFNPYEHYFDDHSNLYMMSPDQRKHFAALLSSLQHAGTRAVAQAAMMNELNNHNLTIGTTEHDKGSLFDVGYIYNGNVPYHKRKEDDWKQYARDEERIACVLHDVTRK